MVFMSFIERETHNFILEFMEIFPWRETVLRAPRMESGENHFVIHKYFSLFLKSLKIFLNQIQSLIVGR